MLFSRLCHSRKLRTFLLLVFCLFSTVQAQRSRQESKDAAQRRLTSQEVIQKVSKSLVSIVTQDKEGQPIAQASGFFFKDGLVASNLHVFKRASQGYVKIHGEGVTHKISEIVAIDLPHDLCVFRASAASAQPLILATGTKIAVGDDVYVAGNPLGLEATFSKGIISALRPERGLIQIDAAISAGSSGGPVVNTKAEVVGIAASSVVNGQNLNFAIEANYLGALPREWKAPVVVAAALALRDREIDELKGPVRSVTTKTVIYVYDQFNDRYVEGRVAFTVTKAYDYDGNLIERFFYKDGDLQTRTLFEYNEKGFMVRSSASDKTHGEKSVAVSESDWINRKINDSNVYEYDHSLVSEADATTVKTGKKQVLKTVRTFDNNGWETEEAKYYDGKPDFAERHKYEADGNGNWIKRYTATYNPNFPEIGFSPTVVEYREIRYHDIR